MADAAPTGLRVEDLARIWWVRLPLTARHLSMGLANTLFDGVYLVAWPHVAAAASPIALLLGLLWGAAHPGYNVAFSESVPLLLLMVVLGTLSGHLGILFLVGYAVGDFGIAAAEWTRTSRLLRDSVGVPVLDTVLDIARVRVPLLIEYGLMATILIFLPVVAKTLLHQLTVLVRLERQAAFLVSAIVHAGITFGVVYLWSQSVPLLIRPLFTWRDVTIPAAAVVHVQEGGVLLAVVAVLASVVRMALQAMTAYLPRYQQPVDAVVNLARAAPVVVSLGERLPSVPVTLLRALATMLLLAGVYESWIDALVLGALILVIAAARARLIPVPLGRWPDIIRPVPILVRVLVALPLIYVLARVLEPRMMQLDTFRPVVILVGLSMVIFYVLSPLAGDARPAGGEPTARAPSVAPTAMLLLAVLALAGVTPDLAWADNCQTPDDCFGVQRSALAAMIGTLALTFLSVGLDLIPGVGTVKGVIEGITGRDLITGERLAAWERAIGWLPLVGRAGDVLGVIGDMSRVADNVTDTVRAADNVTDAASAAATVRRATDVSDTAADTSRAADAARQSDRFDESGAFRDPDLEAGYQRYVDRKTREGGEPRERAAWEEARDFWINDSPIARGNAFDRVAGANYFFNEVHLRSCYRVDSYVPGTEIISRKATDFDAIQESTFREYVDEFRLKYKPGEEIRSNTYRALDGEQLEGNMILEVPDNNLTATRRELFEGIAREGTPPIEIRYTPERGPET